jgi:outer membrane immunogenic protein
MSRWVLLVMAFGALIHGTGRAVFAQAADAALPGAAPLEVTLAYSADRTNGVAGGCGCFWLSGGRAEANSSLTRGIGIVSQIAGEHASKIGSTLNSLSFVSYLFGPRYSFRNHSRLLPFVQFLAGGVHGFDGSFPGPGVLIQNPDAFAFAAGGGLNLSLSPHFAMRAVQADYFQSRLPNDGSNVEDHLQLSAGIVLRFPSARPRLLGRNRGGPMLP